MLGSNVLNRWIPSSLTVHPHIPYIGTLVLVLVAPFEQQQPTINLPVRGLTIQHLTNVELVLLVVLGSWAMWCLLTRRRPQVKTALTLPVLLLLGAMLLSTLLAPAHRIEAFNFTGRVVLGFAVYLLVVNSVTSWRHLLGVVIAVCLTGTTVAVLGILERQQISPVLAWLEAFKIGPSWVGGEPRISATLQYPTITSMYLEFVFGLTLGLLLFVVRRNMRWLTVAVIIALALMGETIILTLSRSGLIVMATMLVGTGSLWLARRGFDRGVWSLVAVAGLLLGLLGSSFISHSNLWLRLTTENDETWYGVEYQVPAALSLDTGEVRSIDVTLTNTGRVTWQPGGEAPYSLSYHWLDPQGDEALIFEGLRTPFPRPVRPGEQIEMTARVQAPPEPGGYRLAWDVVHEGRVWFSTKNAESAYSRAMVEGAPTEQEIQEPIPTSAIDDQPVLGRFTLWRLAGRMLADHPWFGVGPDNFRLLYGPYAGLEDWHRGLHTNNMYVEFFVDTGLIGGLLFLWLLYNLVQVIWRTWSRLHRHLSLFLGVSAAVGGFLLHGLVDYFFEFTSTYLMIWIILGLAVAFAQNKLGEEYAHRL